jgi:hypothetical protein
MELEPIARAQDLAARRELPIDEDTPFLDRAHPLLERRMRETGCVIREHVHARIRGADLLAIHVALVQHPAVDPGDRRPPTGSASLGSGSYFFP